MTRDWNGRLVREGLPVIAAHTPRGVQSQMASGDGDARYLTGPDNAPKQLPTLDELTAALAEREWEEAIASEDWTVSGRPPHADLEGYGVVQGSVPRPSRYRPTPARALGQCKEPGCESPVVGRRSTKRYCAEHSTPAAKMHRRRAKIKNGRALPQFDS
jgi:hypothetical protein